MSPLPPDACISPGQSQQAESKHVFQLGGRGGANGHRGRFYHGKDGADADDPRLGGRHAEGGAGVFFLREGGLDAESGQFLTGVVRREVAVAVFEGGLRFLGAVIGGAGFFLQLLRVGEVFALLAGAIVGDISPYAATEGVEHGGGNERVLHTADEGDGARLFVRQNRYAFSQFVDEVVRRRRKKVALAVLYVFAEGDSAVRQAIGCLYGNIGQRIKERHRSKDVRIEAGAQGVVAGRRFHSDVSHSEAPHRFILRDSRAFGGSQHPGFVFLGKEEGDEKAEEEAEDSAIAEKFPMLPASL